MNSTETHKRVTGETLYEEHCKLIAEEGGTQLPSWFDLSEWERSIWEEVAVETLGPNHDG